MRKRRDIDAIFDNISMRLDKEGQPMLEILNRIALAANASTDVELARRLGLSQQSVAKARATQNVPTSWLVKASTLFEVSLDWLYYGRPPMRARLATAGSLSPSAALPEREANSNMLLVPVVPARLAAHASTWEAAPKGSPRYAFHVDWLAQKGDPDSMVLMSVNGDAMKPAICHGDMVLIDLSQVEVLGYAHFAVAIDGAVYIKQLRSRPGTLILHSLNPEYGDIEVDMGTTPLQSVRILGRAVWVGRDLV